MKVVTGKSLGLVVCSQCHGIARTGDGDEPVICPVCQGTIEMRKPESISRSLAFLIAAAILYIPANLLPVMTTTTLFGTESDTIISGVIVLINSGSWPLGALVFFASIVVPLLKIFSLSILNASVLLHSGWAPLQRTWLYRFVEFVGRWSMLDIYVITLLAGLVQIQSLATIKPEAGAIAFGAVVVLTMLSAMSFESRLIWDYVEGHDD
ncbi:paraquat-inducible protein A [Oxalobacteraceae bacterium GrIS 2.11]